MTEITPQQVFWAVIRLGGRLTLTALVLFTILFWITAIAILWVRFVSKAIGPLGL